MGAISTIGADDDGNKRCSLCQMRKPRTEFGSNGAHWDGLSNWCRECTRNYNTNPSGGYWRRRESKWKSRNIIERDDMPLRAQTFKLVMTYQNNCCALCNRGQMWGGLHADHDHATGLFRGALCHDCNRALGSFENRGNYGGPVREAVMRDYLDSPPYERWLSYIERLANSLNSGMKSNSADSAQPAPANSR